MLTIFTSIYVLFVFYSTNILSYFLYVHREKTGNIQFKVYALFLFFCAPLMGVAALEIECKFKREGVQKIHSFTEKIYCMHQLYVGKISNGVDDEGTEWCHSIAFIFVDSKMHFTLSAQCTLKI